MRDNLAREAMTPAEVDRNVHLTSFMSATIKLTNAACVPVDATGAVGAKSPVRATFVGKSYQACASEHRSRSLSLETAPLTGGWPSDCYGNDPRCDFMKGMLAITGIVMAALIAGGCATRKYVRNTAAPIEAKVDQVGDQTSRNGQAIEETKNQVKNVDEKAQSGISAAQERAATADQHAATADQHASEAMNRANDAAQNADQANRGLDSLRQVVSNLDDYKLQSSTTVAFKFNQYTLSADAKQDLDKVADDVKSDKRFFIAVEGYTDNIGTRQYNEALSQERADKVVEYLVAKHDIPISRVHMIGLGEERPVDEGRNQAARAKNRRVEVKVFSADQVTASLAESPSDNSASRSSR
jgi:OmpA-OmpF porin, OOP family